MLHAASLIQETSKTLALYFHSTSLLAHSICNNKKSTSTLNKNQHSFILNSVNTENHSASFNKHYQTILKGLKYDTPIIITNTWKQNDFKKTPKPLPKFIWNPKQQQAFLDINKIHFMQSSIWVVFHNNQYDVISTANDLKNKSIKVTDPPTIHVWEDSRGRI